MLASRSSAARYSTVNSALSVAETGFNGRTIVGERSVLGARFIWVYNISGRGARRMLRSHILSNPNQNKRDVMARKLTKNNAHFQRAVKRLPLGVASNFRYWGEDRTIYVKRGLGARITDLDDNGYVDYRLGYGPAILGYAHPEVDQAAREGMGVGGVF